MTGYFKWIGAGLGLYLTKGSFLGAFLGFLIGGFIDNFQRAAKYLNESNNHAGPRSSYNQRQNYRSPHDIFQFYQQQQSRYSLSSTLLILSAAVMKADKKVLKSELNFVKEFLKVQLGPQYNSNLLKELKEYIDRPNLPIAEVCRELRMRANPQTRTQLIHYLFNIAKSDGQVSVPERQVIEMISRYLGVSSQEYSSVQENYHRNTSQDYQTLGVTKESTDSEIKKAYRKLALKYHPDKVNQLDFSEQKRAKEKFQKIQEAYEAIKKERGF